MPVLCFLDRKSCRKERNCLQIVFNLGFISCEPWCCLGVVIAVLPLSSLSATHCPQIIVIVAVLLISLLSLLSLFCCHCRHLWLSLSCHHFISCCALVLPSLSSPLLSCHCHRIYHYQGSFGCFQWHSKLSYEQLCTNFVVSRHGERGLRMSMLPIGAAFYTLWNALIGWAIKTCFDR